MFCGILERRKLVTFTSAGAISLTPLAIEKGVAIVGPTTLLQVESLLESIDDCLVGGLGLTVTLWVPQHGQVESNSPPVAELFEVV